MFDKKLLKFTLINFVVIEVLLIALYFSSMSVFLTKMLLEVVSTASLLIAIVICWMNYSRTGSKLFLWCTLWISALFIRDLHLVELDIPVFSSLPYYLLIGGAVAWGWPKRKVILKELKQNQIVLYLWGMVCLFYGTAYLWDHGVLHNTLPISRMLIDPFETYFEESSEAIGSLLLMASAFVLNPQPSNQVQAKKKPVLDKKI